MGNSRDIFTNKRNYSQKRMMRGKKKCYTLETDLLLQIFLYGNKALQA